MPYLPLNHSSALLNLTKMHKLKILSKQTSYFYPLYMNSDKSGNGPQLDLKVMMAGLAL
jgi:hypothetical protein